ncbi:MAG: CoxE, partial [Acidimicrobiales bacterium]
MTNALFAGVDRAIFAATFADRLRRAGVDVSFSALERCATALDVAGPMTLSDLYWVCRLSFVSRHTQLERFDAVFGAVFDTEAGTLRSERRGQEPAPSVRDDERLVPLRRELADESTASGGLPWATLPSISSDDSDDDPDASDDLAIPELRPSATTSEMQRPFDLLDEAEL